MNRFVFGQGWVQCCDETNGEGDGNGSQGGGAGAPGGDGGDAGGGEGAGGEGGGDGDGAPGAAGGAAGEKKEEAPKDMKAAIDAALGYTKEGEGGEKKPAAKAGEKKPAAGAEGKESETHHANGKPKKDEKGQDLDAEGKVVTKQAPKTKTAAELDLKPDERKLLNAKTQQRFGEMITTLKSHEGTIAKQGETIKTLSEARDAILGVMEETKTTQDQLAGYLEFNALLQSGDPKDLEEALKMVEAQRMGIYKVLGREPEGGGIDLLKDFPDLAKQVEDEEITRAAALEIAKGRRDKAARDAATARQQQHQQTQQQTAEQRKAAGEKALKDIETWTASLSKSDLDYKAKEDKLLAKLDGVLKSYPPNQWLPTLKLLYEGIEIQKAPAAGGAGKTPLRPSGARPGAKAPNSMLDAINQGLGYAGAEKG